MKRHLNKSKLLGILENIESFLSFHKNFNAFIDPSHGVLRKIKAQRLQKPNVLIIGHLSTNAIRKKIEVIA